MNGNNGMGNSFHVLGLKNSTETSVHQYHSPQNNPVERHENENLNHSPRRMTLMSPTKSNVYTTRPRQNVNYNEDADSVIIESDLIEEQKTPLIGDNYQAVIPKLLENIQNEYENIAVLNDLYYQPDLVSDEVVNEYLEKSKNIQLHYLQEGDLVEYKLNTGNIKYSLALVIEKRSESLIIFDGNSNFEVSIISFFRLFSFRLIVHIKYITQMILLCK